MKAVENLYYHSSQGQASHLQKLGGGVGLQSQIKSFSYIIASETERMDQRTLLKSCLTKLFDSRKRKVMKN